MADIFSDIANFAGSTLKQVITPDNVRDYTHASKLFVGDQYRLVPKNGFLFHVFIDVNNPYLDAQNPNSLSEVGLMTKSADLPKFTVETKTFNAYNRPNIVQNKLRYDPITITFHDDSNNLIRNFWSSYMKYYYRDSDYAENSYAIPHKYSTQQLSGFGYSPKQNAPYLKCIRLYSLHQKRFSEYILINPIIKSLKHGTHAQDKTETMQHDMTIEYEAVLYNSGRTSIGDPKGFALLHYDNMPSPITPGGGGARSIFGPGGLLDTGKDVLDDISNGNFGSAIFKAARGINNARGMNLKTTAITEITDQFNRSIRESISSQRIVVPNFLGTSSIVNSPYNGIGVSNAVTALAGVVAIRETRVPEPLNAQRIDDIRQSTASRYPEQITNYKKTFPPNPGAVSITTAPSSLALFNDQNNLTSIGVQGDINESNRKQQLDNKIKSTGETITNITIELARAKDQESGATAAISMLNVKLNAARALPLSSPNRDALISDISQSIEQQQKIKIDASALVAALNSKLASITQQLQALKSEKDAIK